MTTSTTRPEDQRLGLGANVLYGFQHVLTMYGGIIAVPLIIGQAAGLNTGEIGILIASCLFMGGLATMLQTLGIPFFGCKLPLVQGVSFASVATIVAILTAGGGLPTVFGAVIAASVIGLLITPVFSRIIRFFPPLVTGSVITAIGLSLMPVAARWAMGGNSKAPDFGSMSNIGLAAATLAFVLLLSKLGSAAISRLSILLAMVMGTLLAVATGMADFSRVGQGPVFAFPSLFHFGAPKFEIAAIFSMLIVIMVVLVETAADILAVGDIIQTDIDAGRLGDGLRADMLSSAVAPLFGTVTASGIRTLSKVSYENNMNLIIVATSIGFGMIPIAAPDFYHHFPSWVATIFHSGISSAAIMAITLNILFNHIKAGNSENQSVFVAGTEWSTAEVEEHSKSSHSHH